MKFTILLILYLASVNCEYSSSESDSSEDCAEGSLDDLNLSRLLLSASENDECLEEARSVFKRMHAYKQFTITGPFVRDGENAFYETKNMMIEIRNFEVAKQFLRAFGKYVQVLSVYFDDMDTNEGKEIAKHINDACSNSTALKSLSLQECADDMLDELQARFSSVLTLSFSSDANIGITIRSDALKLVDIFPNVIKLFVGHTVPWDWKFIGGRFAHLRLFGVELASKSNENVDIDEQVVHFLKHNSRIHSFLVFHSNLKFLKGLADISPQFEELKLVSGSENYKNYDGEPIHFKRLKFLDISSGDGFYPEHVHFDSLHTITLFLQSEFNEKWSEFIDHQTNTDLRSLDLRSERLTNQQILAIAEQKPKLRTARIESDLNITADTVLRFINQTKSLTSLELHVPITDDEGRELVNKMPWFWTVKISPDATEDRAIITAFKMYDLAYVDENANANEEVDEEEVEDEVEDEIEDEGEIQDQGEDENEVENEIEEGNGSSSLATHSMQSLTISLIYLITKFF